MRLSIVSRNFKIGVNIFIGLIIVYYLFILLLIPMGKKARLVLFPPKNLPNPVYGQLDPLEMEPKAINGTNIAYVLNTKKLALPTDLPPTMTVYKFKAPAFSYEAGKTARKDALSLGFDDADLVTDLKGDIYRWSGSKTGGTLEISIRSRELILTTPFGGKSAFYPSGTFTNNEALITYAKSLFKSLSRYDDALYGTGTQKVYLGRISGNEIYETKFMNEAQIARIDFFRSINKFPIVPSDFKKGLLHAYVKKPDSAAGGYTYPVVEAYYWDIDTQSTATYPIIPVQTVWEIVSKGGGFISNVTPKDANPFGNYRPVKVEKILVNDIYLAYYETPKFQKYLQPIYVFEGNYTTSGGEAGEITIYYPAISGDYIKALEVTSLN